MGAMYQTAMAPRRWNCPNTSSMKKRGIPPRKSIKKYGMRKAPVKHEGQGQRGQTIINGLQKVSISATHQLFSSYEFIPLHIAINCRPLHVVSERVFTRKRFPTPLPKLMEICFQHSYCSISLIKMHSATIHFNVTEFTYHKGKTPITRINSKDMSWKDYRV